MRSLPWIARAVSFLAWAGVLSTILGFHPALRVKGPVAILGRQLAEDTARGSSVMNAIGFYDPTFPWVALALLLSLIYIGIWVLYRIARPGPLPVSKPEQPSVAARSITILAGALAAQTAGTLAVLSGGTETSFYLGAAGVMALMLIPLARIRTGADPEAPEPASPARLIIGGAVGVVLVLLAGPLDTALSVRTGAPMFPEAWFPLQQLFATRGKLAEASTLAMLQIAAVLALAQGHRPGARLIDGWPALAPAYILVLGASSPLRGLTTVFVAEILGRAGGGWITRAAFVVATIALSVIVALAMTSTK
ncbi:MAG TPA: hypothetical protein VK661_07700 [Planctomycetota bacterium]|nr:hypothetical protein [Planctomycetota bacterium]